MFAILSTSNTVFELLIDKESRASHVLHTFVLELKEVNANDAQKLRTNELGSSSNDFPARRCRFFDCCCFSDGGDSVGVAVFLSTVVESGPREKHARMLIYAGKRLGDGGGGCGVCVCVCALLNRLLFAMCALHESHEGKGAFTLA